MRAGIILLKIFGAITSFAAMGGAAYGIDAGFESTNLSDTAKSWLIFIVTGICWLLIASCSWAICGVEWESDTRVQIELGNF